MAVTMQQVRAELDPDEPDYACAAGLGADALPHLETLIEGADAQLAAKAASLAGMISAADSSAVLEKAARHGDPRVRVAAAAASRNLSDAEASRLLSHLVGDSDIGVQKVALRSVPPAMTAELQDELERVGRSADPAIASLVQEARSRTSRGAAQGEGEMPQGEMSGSEPDANSMPFGGMTRGNGTDRSGDMPSGPMNPGS
jgi:hypothetical protein